MCGIAGVIGHSLDVNKLLDNISHRGPDGRGVFFDKNIQFGHVRLAIQDFSNSGAQPMTVDKTTVIYNGEAWNTEELKKEFKDRKWNSTSDTEPIAALLAREGFLALNKIDGMFAIAWTNNQGTWIAKDRYGKIPLYLARTEDGFAFASEIKAFPKNTKAMALKSGTALNLETMESVNWVTKIKPEECEPENILNLLRSGVKQRLISDRPLCFLLSGGLDSSLVLALGRELYKDVVAYTAVLDPASPDLIAARRIASHFDVPLVEVKIPNPSIESIREAVLTIENPMKAQVEIAIAHIPLMKAIASDGFRVALSGEAADELFCGYGNMQIASSRAKSDSEYQSILKKSVEKMSRGNFIRVNKVMMSAGVEGRLPFMEERLVATALMSTKKSNPPGKKVLKQAAESILPKWVINRPKETFQGATGTAKEVSKSINSPIKYYNAEAKSFFGWLPKE